MSKPVSIHDVLTIANKMASADVRVRDNHREISKVRNAAYRAARDLTGRSYPTIGLVFHRCHSAVYGGAKVARQGIVDAIKERVSA